MPHFVRGGLLAVLLAAALTLALFLPGAVTRAQLRVGDIAQTTMTAPRDLTYVDLDATATLRRQAAAAVPVQWSASNGQQLQADMTLATVLSTAIRMQFQGQSARNLDARAQTIIQLSHDAVSSNLALQILGLSPRQLEHVQQITAGALFTASTAGVKPAQLGLKQGSPAFSSPEPPGTVRNVAAQLYAGFLRPNRVADPARTEIAQRAAAAAVRPVMAVYQHSQVIVRLGDVITPALLTALDQAGLSDKGDNWQTLAADAIISLVAAGLLHGYLISIKSPTLIRPRKLLLLDTVFLSTAVAAVFVLQGHGLLPYVFPAAMLSMLLTVLFNAELSVLATMLWAVLAGWYVGGSFEIATYYLVTGITGALLVREVRRSSEYFVAGFCISLVGLVTIFAFKLLNQGYDWLGLGTYTVSVLVSGGLAAALTLGSLPGLGRLFGVTTSLNLLELSHPNHPLLRRLMQEAPGTFHHSMMIGTLAERAAEQIGADTLLVRVAAYFHDIGKLYNPTNFVENQSGIANVHELLEPRQSVDLIVRHVFEGVNLARQFHLPEVLEDGIWQHHGTTLVGFFYRQAVELYDAGEVRAEDYRYPGPKPQSRETAILMLADGVEAAVRASPGVDGHQIRAIIHRLAQDRLQDGQFDECSLTLRDLAVIEESFAIVLEGISHPRVQYPAPVPAASTG